MKETEAGVVLIIVLWTIALLSFYAVDTITAIKIEAKQVQYELQRSKATIAAESGVHIAIFNFISNENLSNLKLDFEGDTKLEIEIISERGKFDLNFSDTDFFQTTLISLNFKEDSVRKFISYLKLHREQSLLLNSIEELQLILDFNFYKNLEPIVTLWTGMDRPDPDFFQPLSSLKKTQPKNPGSVFTVVSTASISGGFSSKISVTLRVDKNNTKPYQILRWVEH